jgi:hypothetical protein
MRYFNSIFFLLLLFTLGCDKKEDTSNEIRAVNMPPVMDLKYTTAGIENDVQSKIIAEHVNGNHLVANQRKIIKEGSMELETKHIRNAKKEIDKRLKAVSGYCENESFQNYSEQLSWTLKLKIPAEKFDSFVNSMETGDDKIKRKSIQVRDVTAEYIDVTSRIDSKQKYLTRYLDLLRKAASIKDILEIEDKVSTVTEELESHERVRKSLDQQVSYSSLSIELTQEKGYLFSKPLSG